MPDPPSIELHLPSHFASSDGRPLFLATDRINGSIRLNNTAHHAPDAIKIVLQGYYYNCILPTMTTMAVNQNQFTAAENILYLTDVHENDGSWTESSTSSDSGVDIPFYFHIPERTDCSIRRSISEGTSFRDQWDSHPSSISMPPSKITIYNYADSLAATRVIYEVKAFALKNNKVLNTKSAEIRLFNSSTPSPPLCPSDFPGEYYFSQEKALRSALLVRTGKLCVNVVEPAPLEFSASHLDASTALPLHFELLTSTSSSSPSYHPPSASSFEASITWKLKSSTVISVKHLGQSPTMNQLKRSVHAACVSSLSAPSRRKLLLTDWKASSLADDSSARSGALSARVETYTTEPVLWLSKSRQQADLHLPPTFSVPYLCRKYSFVIHIEVSSSMGRATFDLEVPVQIVYRTENQQTTDEDVGSDRSAGGQEGENRGSGQFDTAREEEVMRGERLPSYVP